MLHLRSLAQDVHAYRRAVEALPPGAINAPAAGCLAWLEPLDVPGGLALAAWLGRQRMRAILEGRPAGPFRCPFDPQLAARPSKAVVNLLRSLHPAAQLGEA